ncbi:hypothetical protein, partial [Escherichia coli]|uniref:hypothetical protein n=1 Tax=Escherichia coli TaxID=562 RepID=UPI001BB1BF44
APGRITLRQQRPEGRTPVSNPPGCTIFSQKFPSKNISFLNNYFIHFLNFLLLRHQRQNQAITLK